MSRIALLGATGSLGSHVLRQAAEDAHEVSVFVRTPSKMPPDLASRAKVTVGDVVQSPSGEIARFAAGHDVFVSCAGLVTEGDGFVRLFDRVVTDIESLPASERPTVCWFLAGAGLLDLDERGRRGVDLPKVRDIYWPHRVNFERLQRSPIGWRLLCPGPMVQGAAIGVQKLRVSTDRLPVALPRWTRSLPGPLLLPFFAARIPEMIIPYADAAAFMLANATPDAFERKRVGLALPQGMKGKKDHWAARPASSS